MLKQESHYYVNTGLPERRATTRKVYPGRAAKSFQSGIACLTVEDGIKEESVLQLASQAHSIPLKAYAC